MFDLLLPKLLTSSGCTYGKCFVLKHMQRIESGSLWFLYQGHRVYTSIFGRLSQILSSSPIAEAEAEAYGKRRVLRLVAPDRRHRDDEFLLTHLGVLRGDGRRNLGQGVLVDCRDVVRCHVHGRLAKLSQLGSGIVLWKIEGCLLPRVQEKLDAFDGRLFVTLPAPCEVRAVFSAVADGRWDFGLRVTFETLEVSIRLSCRRCRASVCHTWPVHNGDDIGLTAIRKRIGNSTETIRIFAGIDRVFVFTCTLYRSLGR